MPFKNPNDRRAYIKRHYLENMAAYKERARKRHLEHPEKNMESYYRHREKRIAAAKEYAKKNKEKISQKKKEKYLDKIKNKPARFHVIENYDQLTFLERRREYQKRYFQNKKNDIQYKITRALRQRVREVITKGYKSKKTLSLLGCSIEFLRGWLESQFKFGMSWDNYGIGGWEIDHIIPCSYFDLKNHEDQIKCFNYKNLQPLWYYENRSKGAKIA